MAQRTIRTPKKRATFLDALRESANVSVACTAAHLERRRVYEWRDEDATFRAAWDDALEDACDHLEQVARRRAEEQSDTLLIFLLKAHRPAKYRESVTHEHSGPAGAAIPIRFTYGDVIAEVATGSVEDRADD